MTDEFRLREIANLEDYKVRLATTCVQNGKVVGIRVGVSDGRLIDKKLDVKMLETMGGPSTQCDTILVDKDDYIEVFSMFTEPEYGIAGFLYRTERGRVYMYGSVAGERHAVTFSADK